MCVCMEILTLSMTLIWLIINQNISQQTSNTSPTALAALRLRLKQRYCFIACIKLVASALLELRMVLRGETKTTMWLFKIVWIRCKLSSLLLIGCDLRSAICSAGNVLMDNLHIALNTRKASLTKISSSSSWPSEDATEPSGAGPLSLRCPFLGV